MHNATARCAPIAVCALISLHLGVTSAQTQPDRPVFLPDGSVQVPAFVLPPSDLISEESLAFMKSRAATPGGNSGALQGTTIEAVRASTETALASRVEAMGARYPVEIVDKEIGGVPTRVITPFDGAPDSERVLINLHGGAFQTCWPSCGLLESIPISVVGQWKVVTVNYRQGPENVFPAASEDVAAVYRELLRRYRSRNIGIYGCSAGGMLTAEAVAWFQREGLPRPGAIGVFGASAGRTGRGDSSNLSAYIDGSFPPPPKEGEVQPAPLFRSYFEGADPSDPLVSPLVSPAVLELFPATLVVTATRAADLSGAVYSHYQLKKHGVDAELLVAEGQGHCYMYDSNLPESRDAFEIISRFFDEHL